MTRRQRYIVGLLAIANAALLVTLLVFATRFSASTSSLLGLPSPVPTYGVQTHLAPPCQRRAVEMLLQAGLGGTTTLAGRVLRCDLVYRAATDGHAEDVAQQVWTAFDVAMALVEDQCEPFSRVEIVIEAQGAPPSTQIYAAVDLADLEAFYDGELGEDAFIDRVDYRVKPEL